MTLREVRQLAQVLLEQHGLTDLGWTFRWDTTKRRAGCCKYRIKSISLSQHYVNLNPDKPDDIKDTILHEIAHALTGPGKGHGPEWKANCVKIGAKPIRCYDSQTIAMPKGKYRAVCPTGCGKEFRRHRRPSSIGGRYYFCTQCGPTARLTFRCE